MVFLLNKCSRHLCIAIIALGLFCHQSAYAAPKDAANFVNDLAARVINIVKRVDIGEKDKEDKLNNIFVQSVDTRWIGKFAMGRYWRNISPDQQAQYLDLYSNYLTGLYVPNFRKYTGNIVKVINATEVRPKEYLVQTELTDELNTINIKINYRLLQNEQELEKFIIFDVIAEGVSLITTQRAELNSVMAQGDFNALMSLLTRKVAANK